MKCISKLLLPNFCSKLEFLIKFERQISNFVLRNEIKKKKQQKRRFKNYDQMIKKNKR